MILHDLAATETLAQHLARLARPGDALLLSGPLGAGKSALARAFLRALLGDPALEVPSPSYTLVQSYPVPGEGRRIILTFTGWAERKRCWNWDGMRRWRGLCWWNGPKGWAPWRRRVRCTSR